MRESCMYKIKRNTRGASVIIALLVFLLAALSGTIALTMATSNAGRYTHEKEDQQAYLSVVSAGNLILDRLNGLSIVFRCIYINQTPRNENDINISFQGGGKRDLFLSDGSSFMKNLKQSTLSGNEWSDIEFYLEASEASGMGTVCVRVSKSGSFFLFRLYHQKGTAKNYQMTLNVPCTSDEAYHQVPDGEYKDYYQKTMEFNADSAKYIVENVSSGGTGE